jgi:hypothetical protein
MQDAEGRPRPQLISRPALSAETRPAVHELAMNPDSFTGQPPGDENGAMFFLGRFMAFRNLSHHGSVFAYRCEIIHLYGARRNLGSATHTFLQLEYDAR